MLSLLPVPWLLGCSFLRLRGGLFCEVVWCELSQMFVLELVVRVAVQRGSVKDQH